MKSARHTKQAKQSCAVADFTLAKIRLIVLDIMTQGQANIAKLK